MEEYWNMAHGVNESRGHAHAEWLHGAKFLWQWINQKNTKESQTLTSKVKLLKYCRSTKFRCSGAFSKQVKEAVEIPMTSSSAEF